ncbi:MAG: formate dehydrogenase accessory sulfurtransferase FdhD [Anaerolineae bacterium]|nr:formate dehydrogenase accessory sulfurtransferase FdhD [Anaerolineae bacterium]
MTSHQPGALPYTYYIVEGDRIETVAGGVIDELLLTIFVNLQELATVMCSPIQQEALALGFLYNEGIIDSLDEVRLLRANVHGSSVDIFLNRSDFEPPRRRVITSGCSGGVSFQDILAFRPPLASGFQVTPDVLLSLRQEFKNASRLYNDVRGVHTTVLGGPDGLLLSAEDVGRHNTIDKIAGLALQAGLDTRDKILLTSGRISSEMLNKARRLGVPIVASHTSPTSLSLRLAAAWGICVVGYMRRGSMRVYTHPQRLGITPDPAAASSSDDGRQPVRLADGE